MSTSANILAQLAENAANIEEGLAYRQRELEKRQALQQQLTAKEQVAHQGQIHRLFLAIAQCAEENSQHLKDSFANTAEEYYTALEQELKKKEAPNEELLLEVQQGLVRLYIKRGELQTAVAKIKESIQPLSGTQRKPYEEQLSKIGQSAPAEKVRQASLELSLQLVDDVIFSRDDKEEGLEAKREKMHALYAKAGRKKKQKEAKAILQKHMAQQQKDAEAQLRPTLKINRTRHPRIQRPSGYMEERFALLVAKEQEAYQQGFEVKRARDAEAVQAREWAARQEEARRRQEQREEDALVQNELLDRLLSRPEMGQEYSEDDLDDSMPRGHYRTDTLDELLTVEPYRGATGSLSPTTEADESKYQRRSDKQQTFAATPQWQEQPAPEASSSYSYVQAAVIAVAAVFAFSFFASNRK